MLKFFLTLVIGFGIFGRSPIVIAAETSLVFIVNAENPVQSLSTSDIVDYFYKNVRDWPNGEEVRFIDHQEESSLRRAFLNKYLDKTPRELDLYWIGQKLYSGNSAPIQVSSEAMVISLISRFKGAISYLSGESELIARSPKIKKIELNKR